MNAMVAILDALTSTFDVGTIRKAVRDLAVLCFVSLANFSFRCHPGHILVGSSTTICTENGWIGGYCYGT